jgi:hypothetical protein
MSLRQKSHRTYFHFPKRHVEKGKRKSKGYDMALFSDGNDLMITNMLKIAILIEAIIKGLHYIYLSFTASCTVPSSLG